MSLLEHPAVRSSALRLEEFEDAFCAWAHDPAEPDVVDLGQHGQVAMVELSRCRSFRAASYFLCRLARLDADLRPTPHYLGSSTIDSGGHPDVC